MREVFYRHIKKVAQQVGIAATIMSATFSFALADDASPTLSQQQAQSVASTLQKNPDLAQKVQSILAGAQPGTVTSTQTSGSTTTTTVAEPSISSPAPSDSMPAAQSMSPLPNGAQNSNASSPNLGTASVTQADTGELSPQWREIVNKQAYKNVLQQAFPLSPNQILNLHNRLDDTQRAAATPAYSRSPEPTSTSLVLNLSPGASPPVIRLALGFVSSLVFVDSTGAPWPIEAYDIGNPTAFNITWNKKNNTLMLQARAAYTYGNMAVKLVDLNTPVMLTLVPGQRVVDYRVDLRVPGLGPNAKPDIIGSGLPDEADERLLNVLDGIPPDGSKRLRLVGADAEAWLIDDTIFLRTRFNVLSPAWLATMSSADGMNAYKMATTPLILLSRYGKTTQLHIEGY
jgi:intracellular multiplication protein IcmK